MLLGWDVVMVALIVLLLLVCDWFFVVLFDLSIVCCYVCFGIAVCTASLVLVWLVWVVIGYG